MDIHEKSVDMDMGMDGKFHIHGNPAYGWPQNIANTTSLLYDMSEKVRDTYSMSEIVGQGEIACERVGERVVEIEHLQELITLDDVQVTVG